MKVQPGQDVQFGSPITPMDCAITDLHEAYKALCFADIAAYTHDDLLQTAQLQLLLKDCPESNAMTLVQQAKALVAHCQTLTDSTTTRQYHTTLLVPYQSRICQVAIPLLLIAPKEVQAFIAVQPNERSQKSWKDQINAHQQLASWALFALREQYPNAECRVWLVGLMEGVMVHC